LGVVFNNDGTKMFVTSDSDKDISEYDLSTGFDISTATYSQAGSISSTGGNARNATFNNDGTKIYVCDRTNNTVDEYALSTAFDISTLSYTDDFDVSTQVTNLTDVQFNSDGTKMFALSEGNRGIYRYSLSTAFDVSTASYDSVSFNVGSQETTPAGFVFGGVKLFVTGFNGDDVNEYALPLTFSLGTGSFASADVGKTIEANSGVFVLTATDGSFFEVTAPTSYDQVASGSWEMYAVVYNTTDGDLELSANITGYALGSASFTSDFSVSSQGLAPYGIAFNPDGTKMFVVDNNDSEVNQYTLTTGFDVSTASYASKTFSVSSQDTLPVGIAFNSTGSKMFIVGGQNDSVYEYTLSTVYDVSTASYSQSFSVTSQETQPTGIAFNSDGTKMFICGNASDNVNEYTLSTGFDVSTASFVDAFSYASQSPVGYGLAFSSDGTKMFVAGGSTDVYEYTLSTGFDVSSASFNQTFTSSVVSLRGIAFNPSGTKMFLSDSNASHRTIDEYSTSSASVPSGYHAVHTTTSTDSQYWTDINSMTADEAAGDGAIYYAVSTDDRTTWKIARGTDGERSIVRNNAGTWQYNSNGTYGSTTWTNGTTNTELATLQEAMEGAEAGYGLSDASYDSVSFSVASQDTTPEEVLFNPSGTKMYILGSSNDTVFEYDLTTAFDITTASYQRSKSVTTEDIYPTGMAFNSDGTKMYILGNVNDSVFQYSLSTAYDVSTASYDSVSFSVTSQDTQPYGLAFNTDGTKMFVGGNTGDDVNEYALSTGFDISTASYTQNFSVASQETNIRHVSFKPDGTRMYIVGLEDDVYEYKLTTAFDLSTASFFQTFAMNTEDTSTHGITFNSDGTKMFMVGQSQDKVFQYSTPVYINRMDKTQLDAVPDANHFTLGNDLDLAIIFNLSSGTTVPSSDGVAINFDANSLNQGAILGTDYNWDFPAANKVRITSLAAQNLKVRVL